MGGSLLLRVAGAPAARCGSRPRDLERVARRVERWAARLTRFTTTSDLAALNADPARPGLGGPADARGRPRLGGAGGRPRARPARRDAPRRAPRGGAPVPGPPGARAGPGTPPAARRPPPLAPRAASPGRRRGPPGRRSASTSTAWPRAGSPTGPSPCCAATRRRSSMPTATSRSGSAAGSAWDIAVADPRPRRGRGPRAAAAR